MSPLPSIHGSVIHMTFSGMFAGRERVVFSLAETITKAIDVCVYLIVESRADPNHIEDLLRIVKNYAVKLRIFRTDSRISPSLFIKIATALEEDRAEIIHCHCNKSAVYSLAIRHTLRRRLASIVLTLHGLSLDRTSWSMLLLASSVLSALLVDKIIGCSRPSVRAFTLIPLIRGKACVIPNAIRREILTARERFDLRQTARDQLAVLFSLDRAAFWIANVGRLAPIKNFSMFLQLARRFKDSGSQANLRFLVVGEGPLKEKLVTQARELGVEDRVTFTGFIKDMRSLYLATDILVQTSLYENTPMCLLEGMAYGVPIVAPAVGGNIDLIEHGKNGLLFSRNDLDNLYDCVNSLVYSPEIGISIATHAFTILDERYSEDIWRHRHQALYAQLVARDGGSCADSTVY